MFFLYCLLSFIFLVIVISFVHELGHYGAARVCNVKVEKFSVGFGKECIGYSDKRGCRWQLCPILLGGFVKFVGDDQEDGGEFSTLSWYKKLFVVVAGPAANLFFSFVLFFLLFFASKVTNFSPVVGYLAPNGSAAEVGIMIGDKIEMVNDTSIRYFGDLADVLSGSDNADILVRRGDTSLWFKVESRVLEGRKVFGLGSNGEVVSYSSRGALDSLISANKEFFSICSGIVDSIYHLIVPYSDGKRGEVRSVATIATTSYTMLSMGPITFLWFLSALSINLGIINLLPLLPLDGGRVVVIFFDLFFGGFKRSRYVKNLLAVSGVCLVAMVMVLAVYNDFKYILTLLNL